MPAIETVASSASAMSVRFSLIRYVEHANRRQAAEYTRRVRGKSRIVGALLIAALILVGGTAAARAATLKAEYRFRDDLASDVAGAPELVKIGQGSRFGFARVNGLGRQQVLSFPKGDGLSLAASGLVDPHDNSVVMVFRLGTTTGYRRILDFSGGTSDVGLYNLRGHISLYGGHGGGDLSREVVLGESFVQVALTNAAAPGGGEQATAYLNGDEVAAAKIAEGFEVGSAGLRFFRDNTSGPYPGEESSGAVSCILLYDGTLTAGEVSTIADDPTLCPAPRPTPGRAKASIEEPPKVTGTGRSITVDTGIAVSCPIGEAACAASGRVEAIANGGRTAGGRLGTVRLSVPAGTSRDVRVRLSARGARALRDAGGLKARVAAEIKTAHGRTSRAQQVERIDAPRPPAFRAGTYTGVTSQNLPIVISVSRTAIRSAFFRWHGVCSDGKEHTSTVVIRGRSQVHHGRFSLSGALRHGGSARIAGKIKARRASGTLSRTGATASSARCEINGIGWSAQNSPIETAGRD
jgi:hypothetical protein